MWKYEGLTAPEEVVPAPSNAPRPGRGLPKLPLVELEILRGRARQKVRRVQVPVFLIGAAADCDLVLRDSVLPDVHSYLYLTREAVTIRHLGPAPGLFVEGKKTECATLRHGDHVRIGESFELQVRIHASDEARMHQPPRILRWDSAQRQNCHVGVSNRHVLLSPN